MTDEQIQELATRVSEKLIGERLSGKSLYDIDVDRLRRAAINEYLAEQGLDLLPELEDGNGSGASQLEPQIPPADDKPSSTGEGIDGAAVADGEFRIQYESPPTANSVEIEFDTRAGTANGQAFLGWAGTSQPSECTHNYEFGFQGTYQAGPSARVLDPEGLIRGTATIRNYGDCPDGSGGREPFDNSWTDIWAADYDADTAQVTGCLLSWCYYLAARPNE